MPRKKKVQVNVQASRDGCSVELHVPILGVDLTLRKRIKLR